MLSIEQKKRFSEDCRLNTLFTEMFIKLTQTGNGELQVRRSDSADGEDGHMTAAASLTGV